MRSGVLRRIVFGSLGFTEIAFILILALLLFGPKRLPEIGKTLGKGLAEFRRASNELKRTLENEVAEDERATHRSAAALATAVPLAPSAPLASVAQSVSINPAPSSLAVEPPSVLAPEAGKSAADSTDAEIERGAERALESGAEPR